MQRGYGIGSIFKSLARYAIPPQCIQGICKERNVGTWVVWILNRNIIIYYDRKEGLFCS
jgi:hypothetical protein